MGDSSSTSVLLAMSENGLATWWVALFLPLILTMKKEEAKKPCRLCKEMINAHARRCPLCQWDNRSWVSRHRLWVFLWGCFVLVFLVIPLMNYEDYYNQQFQKSPLEVCTLSQMHIKELLKSPRSAKHPVCDDGEVTRDGGDPNTFYFRSYVDAQNSFGVEVRTDYTCRIRYKTYPDYTISCDLSE